MAPQLFGHHRFITTPQNRSPTKGVPRNYISNDEIAGVAHCLPHYLVVLA